MTVKLWSQGMPVRPCDMCSVCCKLPPAPDLKKPAWQWCQHCDPGKERCTIYAQRPRCCREFQCLWKIMPDFPEELRPDKCKVMWSMTANGTVAVATTEHPDRLETSAHRELIANFRAVGVTVRVQTPAGVS